MKKAKMQVANFIFDGSSSKHVNKKDNKGKPNHEKKKIEMKEQWNKPKKALFKGNYKFCNKYRHKGLIEKKKEKERKKKKGKQLTLVCFESKNVKVHSNTWWIDIKVTIHITNCVEALKKSKEAKWRWNDQIRK